MLSEFYTLSTVIEKNPIVAADRKFSKMFEQFIWKAVIEIDNKIIVE